MNNINVPKDYFEELNLIIQNSVNFINGLKTNSSFCNFLLQENTTVELGINKPDELINSYFTIDTARCLRLISDITNFESREGFALVLLQANLYGLKLTNYEELNLLLGSKGQDVFNQIRTIIDKLKNEIKKSELDDYDFLKLAYILNYYDANLKQIYLKNIYHFTSTVIKSDGTVSAYEEYVLKNIIRRKYEESAPQKKAQNNPEESKVTKLEFSSIGETQSIDSILNELNGLTGLSNVKYEISTLVNFIKVQKERQSIGLRLSSISYHLVFTGNPGTGKTTVARIISKIYKTLGILSLGQLVETDRAGLIAEYLGQTAIKVNKTVDRALNGVLFIDEAYSLAQDKNDSYGEEAVATLIKRMEDDRDKLVVIIAGYSIEMKEFIESNPGLKSRFNRYIEFPDYLPEELLSIFESQCKMVENNLSEKAKTKAKALFEKAYNNRDNTFGNGRFVRNIFEKTLEQKANRIATIPRINKETLTTILDEDIPSL